MIFQDWLLIKYKGILNKIAKAKAPIVIVWLKLSQSATGSLYKEIKRVSKELFSNMKRPKSCNRGSIIEPSIEKKTVKIK